MKLRLQKPSDQPTGSWRLLDDLERILTGSEFSELRLIVAFAKASPLLKLHTAFESFRKRGGRTAAIIGVDAGGTSTEALNLALECFDETYVARAHPRFQATFHPKIYLARGSNKALALIGSNNLTVGGTEINPEALVELAFDLPDDKADFDIVLAAWDNALTVATKLDASVLQSLVDDDLVSSEAADRAVRRSRPRPSGGKSSAIQQFPRTAAKPPRALPARTRRSSTKQAARPSQVAHSLVLEVVPHHNGEVFLSKSAVDQDPAFFGWPFKGRTAPKRKGNLAYPQRLPDPVASIEVVGPTGATVVQYAAQPLNTVYYSRKSEIRITVPMDVIRNAPDYSVLQVSIPSQHQGLDYELIFYAPGSPEHAALLKACNQEMPSGGKTRARRFGWL